MAGDELSDAVSTATSGVRFHRHSRAERLLELQELARAAWSSGQEAMAGGDIDRALAWLDRAHRLASNDPTISLTLATLCLSLPNDGRALGLFETITARHDVKEAWLGLCAAHRRAGDADGASAALTRALAGFVVTPDMEALADVVVRDVGAGGWCGLAAGGVLRIGGPDASDRVEASLDGQTLRAGPQVAARVLPAGWQRARTISVTLANRPIIGSPLDLTTIRRTDGFVETRSGGVSGWAWQPAEPDRPSILTIVASDGARWTCVANDETPDNARSGLLSRPRGFRIEAHRLDAVPTPLRVLGEDGRDILGSPLDPGAERRSSSAAVAAIARMFPATLRVVAASAPVAASIPVEMTPPLRPPSRRVASPPAAVDIVVPVHGSVAATLACLDTVFATVPAMTRIIVVDDNSPEPALVAALDGLARARRIRLIRHATTRGYPISANAGLRAAGSRDVVLLNSDTLLPPRWLERLRDAVYSAPDIGTASPLSNNASILSYPDPSGDNPTPDLAETARLGAIAHRASEGVTVDLPTTVGFCLYVRRACLTEVGVLREDVFAQGYGEENDFCLRARHLGWRHVAAAGVFVTHLGGRSFGGARAHLMARNAAVLNRLHPGYDDLVAQFLAADPLFPARRRMDRLRWRDGSSRRGGAPGGAVVIVTHDSGGGVERSVEAASDTIRARGQRPVILRPLPASAGPGVTVWDGPGAVFPNLRFALPAEFPALLRFLRAQRPVSLMLHHLLGHHPSILDLCSSLGVIYDVHLHDYAAFCQRISLLGMERRYCGEPSPSGCETCIADAGRLIEESLSVDALLGRSAALMARARRVVTPSEDAAARVRRHFPAVTPEVVPHDVDPPFRAPRPVIRHPNGRLRVCVVGAIGIEKGYDVLLACARDAARRDLPIDYVVVGHTVDDGRLMATGSVFVTGPYHSHEAVKLIRSQKASLAFLPSVVPETWCFALTEIWAAGLDVVAFDIGAPAERVRRAGRGRLVPLGLSPPAINNALLAETRQTRHEFGSAIIATDGFAAISADEVPAITGP